MKKHEYALEFLNDEINTRIIREYLDDSRQSIREISRKIGVAPGTVIARMKQCEDYGLIKKFTAQLDFNKMGLVITAITHVQIKGGGLFEKNNLLNKMREIYAIYKVTGGTDIIIIAKFQSTQELDAFTTKLNETSSIRRTRTYVVLDTIKEDFNKF